MVKCRICKGKGYTLKIINGEEVAVKCSCAKREQKKALIDYAVQESSLPSSIVDYDITTYIGQDTNDNLKKVNKYINDFSSKFKNISLYFYGSGSVQKTTLMSYMGRELAYKGIKVYFILMDTLVKTLTDAQRDEEKEKIICNIQKSELLLIDDCFDSKKVTLYKSGWQLSFLDSFLRDRLEVSNKATIFTSNIPLNSLVNQGFSQSIQDMMGRNVHEMIFSDRVSIKNKFDIENIFK